MGICSSQSILSFTNMLSKSKDILTDDTQLMGRNIVDMYLSFGICDKLVGFDPTIIRS